MGADVCWEIDAYPRRMLPYPGPGQSDGAPDAEAARGERRRDRSRPRR